jgi:hypothetical protein
MAGLSKNRYGRATARSLEWRNESGRRTIEHAEDRCARRPGPACRRGGDRRDPRPGRADGHWGRARKSVVRRRPPVGRERLRRRVSGRGKAGRRTAQGSSSSRGRSGVRGHPHIRQQWLALVCLPDPNSAGSGLRVRLGGGSRQMGRERNDVSTRRRTSCRHWGVGGGGVAVAPRRGVRAVPDLPQRALALRATPGGCNSRMSADVCRSNTGSQDAAMTAAAGHAI